MFSDLDYLVINDLTHYPSFVLEEVNHSLLNMIVANHFPVQVNGKTLGFRLEINAQYLLSRLLTRWTGGWAAS